MLFAEADRTEKTDKCYWRSLQIREDIIVNYRTMARTAFQWVFVIVNFKDACSILT